MALRKQHQQGRGLPIGHPIHNKRWNPAAGIEPQVLGIAPGARVDVHEDRFERHAGFDQHPVNRYAGSPGCVVEGVAQHLLHNLNAGWIG